MASMPHLVGIAVIPRDRGAGRVRIGRDGEPIVTYRLGADDAAGSRRGVDGAGRIMAAAGAREVFTANARMQRFDDGFPASAFRFGPGRGAALLLPHHGLGPHGRLAGAVGGRPRRARRGRCGTWSSRTGRRSRPRRA